MNPGFVSVIFNQEEVKTIEKLYQCYEKWRGVYSVKLKAIQNSGSRLQSIVQEAAEKYLDNESITFLKLSRTNAIGNSSERYFNERCEIFETEKSQFIKLLLQDFYTTFDPFCQKFFDHMILIENEYGEETKAKSVKSSPRHPHRN